MTTGVVRDPNYYRVSIDSKNCEVVVIYLGLDSIDDSLAGEYDSVEELPHWMQERLAMLSMLGYQPPTEVVRGVGRRISQCTYWVEKPDPC